MIWADQTVNEGLRIVVQKQHWVFFHIKKQERCANLSCFFIKFLFLLI